MQCDLIKKRQTIASTALKLVDLSKYDTNENDSLYNGNLGKVITNLNLAEYYLDDKYAFRAVKIVKFVINRMGEQKGLKFTTAMSNGLSGLGCVLLLLNRSEFLKGKVNFQDLVYWLAKNVFIRSKEEIFMGNLDPLHSSMGGLYFLAKFARAYDLPEDLSVIVRLLSSKIERNKYGEYLINRRYDKFGPADIQTGLAHGLCGDILSLTEAFFILKDEILKSTIKKLLFYLKNIYTPYNYKEEYFLFPRAVTIEGELKHQKIKDNNNIGWCTSDLTIGYTFLKCGRILKDLEFECFGNEIIKNFMRFNHNVLPISEANFCHGYSGISWMYRKCFSLTERNEYLVMSDLWLEKSIICDTIPTDGGLLMGHLGIYNVLLNNWFDNQLPWDEVFFL